MSVRDAAGQDEWSIRGHLVSRQIFTKRIDGHTRVLLTLLLVDEYGEAIELKTWRDSKAYTVYRKFNEGQSVIVNGSGEIKEANQIYSTAKCAYRWYLTPIDDYIDMKKYLYCVHVAEKAFSSKKPVSFVGIYHQHVAGPMKKTFSGRILAQGYYLTLVDSDGECIEFLVWQNKRVERRCPLDNCTSDSIVLVNYAREQEEPYRSKNSRILTSTYPPVVDPECISPKVLKIIRNARYENGDS